MATSTPAATRAPVTLSIRRPQTWREGISTLWRRSLPVRSLTITLALTVVAILIAGALVVLAVQNELFASRLNQALIDSRRAATSAQADFDAVDPQSDSVNLQAVLVQSYSEIAIQSASARIAVLRIDTAPSATAPQGFITPNLSEEDLSPSLRERVREGGASEQWWQSVTLSDGEGGTVPGIIIGQQLTLPQNGAYEFYLAYDLADATQTLGFVQRTLWVAGLALVVIIGAISWIVLRGVTIPVAQTAATSARLAAGELDERVRVRGEDELATLGRSFNAMADSLQAQIKELADLSLVQQRFVSDVSHELRTPLTTIRLAADVLHDRRDEFDPAVARAAELLHDQVQRFEQMLTDLLEISRYDAGSVQLEHDPVSLANLAEEVVAETAPLAAEHGTELRVHTPGGHTPVEMDPRRIRRIVRNLIGNAIEHGEGRPIVVTVDSTRDAVALSVRDFGLGIEREHLDRVFDRFWRADPSRQRSIGGSGLGLSIALGDARLHGGTLAAWSEPGLGSNFVLTLPRRAGAGFDASPLPMDPGDEARVLVDLQGGESVVTEPIDLGDLADLTDLTDFADLRDDPGAPDAPRAPGESRRPGGDA